MPSDGLSTTATGVCHAGSGCDLYAQDCEPASYAEACVPADLDTTLCFPSGDRTEGEACSWTDSNLYCGQGLYCSPVDGVCYALCDPAGPDRCAHGRCRAQAADDGSPWFGLCL
jgi:hypothetical protein